MSQIDYYDTSRLGRDAGFGRSFAASPRMELPQFTGAEDTYASRWFNATFSAQNEAPRQGASAQEPEVRKVIRIEQPSTGQPEFSV